MSLTTSYSILSILVAKLEPLLELLVKTNEGGPMIAAPRVHPHPPPPECCIGLGADNIHQRTPSKNTVTLSPPLSLLLQRSFLAGCVSGAETFSLTSACDTLHHCSAFLQHYRVYLSRMHIVSNRRGWPIGVSFYQFHILNKKSNTAAKPFFKDAQCQYLI